MVEIVMPRLSDTMDSGVLSRWLKNVGDQIKKGDVIAEIETDKATMDLEAFDAGVLESLLVEEGESVPIGQAVAVIGDGSGTSGGGAGVGGEAGKSSDSGEEAGAKGEDVPIEAVVGQKTGQQDQQDQQDQQAKQDQQAEAGEQDQGGQRQSQQTQPSQGSQDKEPDQQAQQIDQGASAQVAQPSGQRPRTSPLARKIAREHGIDLAALTGSGPGGRIVRADIEDAISALEAGGSPAAPAQQGQAATPKPAEAGTSGAGAPGGTRVEAGVEDEEIPLNNIRRITARRLTESQAAPHFFLTMVVEVEKLLAFRSEVNAGLAHGAAGSATGSEESAAGPAKISVTDLIVRAAAVTLRAHPQVNSSWGNDSIIRRGHVNVGIAVAIEDGLMVPVIRDADRKTLSEISSEAAALAERARAGRLKPDEFSGGTFTISNLGMFGIDQFTAVINPPEAAILAVGAATQEPVLRDGELITVPRMKITLTSDHRVLDGAVAAAFLRDLVRALENPLSIVV